MPWLGTTSGATAMPWPGEMTFSRRYGHLGWCSKNQDFLRVIPALAYGAGWARLGYWLRVRSDPMPWLGTMNSATALP